MIELQTFINIARRAVDVSPLILFFGNRSQVLGFPFGKGVSLTRPELTFVPASPQGEAKKGTCEKFIA
jgi:hypothetical protein